MDIQIETQNVEIPPHATTRLRSRIRKAMDQAGLQITRLHLTLRNVNGKKRRHEKVCTVRATLATGGEVVVVDRSGKMRESLFRALRRSRSVIRRELTRRRQRARKQRLASENTTLETGVSAA
jgi:ribosome-associated translation inhibitor RaiA